VSNPRHLTERTRSGVYRRSKKAHPTKERAINDLRVKVVFEGSVVRVEETETHWIITVEEKP